MIQFRCEDGVAEDVKFKGKLVELMEDFTIITKLFIKSFKERDSHTAMMVEDFIFGGPMQMLINMDESELIANNNVEIADKLNAARIHKEKQELIDMLKANPDMVADLADMIKLVNSGEV